MFLKDRGGTLLKSGHVGCVFSPSSYCQNEIVLFVQEDSKSQEVCRKSPHPHCPVPQMRSFRAVNILRCILCVNPLGSGTKDGVWGALKKG